RAKSVHSIGDVSLHLLAQSSLLKDDRAAAIADWQSGARLCGQTTSTERWCPDEPVLFDNYDGAPATHSLLGAGALSPLYRNGRYGHIRRKASGPWGSL
ncbi:MAG: hypothetical protein IPG74_14570, partial [Flavobacteriales bacterium]|nr:hypothetical protein [Flavobacteriales bacterium]